MRSVYISTMYTIRGLTAHLHSIGHNHYHAIMDCQTFKGAHIYCVLNNITSQKYGPLLESFMIQKFDYIKRSASECVGDCSKNDENIEIKASLGGSHHRKFNYVQIRPSHNISYYMLTAYYLNFENVGREGDFFMFKVPKEDMKGLIAAYGGYAHGTIKEYGAITLDSINEKNNKKEYALRPTFGDPCWQALLRYKIREEEL